MTNGHSYVPISKIYIDPHVADYQEVIAIQSRLNVPSSTIQNIREVFEFVSHAEDPIQTGKEILFITRNRGNFIRKCPGTRHYTCCGYMILHIGTFCTMDCTYCILQSYFHPPVLQYFVNHHELLTELDQIFTQKKNIQNRHGRVYRQSDLGIVDKSFKLTYSEVCRATSLRVGVKNKNDKH